jgi:hypothetical protein
MEEYKEDIIRYAESLMTPKEIGIILELDEIDLKKDEFKRYFHTGFLKSKAMINKSIVDLAQSGSSPAQTIAAKFITDINQTLLIDG